MEWLWSEKERVRSTIFKKKVAILTNTRQAPAKTFQACGLILSLIVSDDDDAIITIVHVLPFQLFS